MSIPEVVEDPVPVALEHLGVDVEARVAKLGDLLGQQLHAVDRVAEDDGLVDAQLLHIGRGRESFTSRVRGRGLTNLRALACQDWEKTICPCTFEKSVLRQCTFCLSSTNA